MYMKNSQILRPPAGGWDSIVNGDPHLLQSLGKSQEVLELLSHLPYINSTGLWGDNADAAPGCLLANWPSLISSLSLSANRAEEIRVMTEGPTFSRLAPHHTFSLTAGDRENPVIVLDTKLGIIHWEDCPADFEEHHFAESVAYEPDDEVPEEEEDWRYGAMAWAIPDFFEALKQQFIELRWIPISEHTVRSTSAGECPRTEEGMMSMLRDIYLQHGWPDLDAFRKSECLEAVKRAMSERYPRSACSRLRG